MKYLCEISYAFFYGQFYTWKVTNYILDKLEIGRNVIKIILSFTVCILLTVILHEIVEKPLKKGIEKLLLKN